MIVRKSRRRHYVENMNSKSFLCACCYILEELALGSTGVSNDADVDVSSQRGPLHGRLGNASKQHQQDAALHLVVA